VPIGYICQFSGMDESGTKIGYNQSGYITAFLPEQFSISTSSQWETLAPSDLTSLLGSTFTSGNLGLVNTIAQATTGYRAVVPALTQLFWVNTTPMTFDLQLQFNAVQSAQAEVTANIYSLLSLTLPSLAANTGSSAFNFLQAPGPSLLSGTTYTSKYNINLSIGSNFLFSNVLVQDVAATIDTMPTSTGDYLSAIVHVRVSTDRIYTKTDLKNAFTGLSQSNAQISGNQITSLGNGIVAGIKSGISNGINSFTSATGA
jgi:hypothetical protein